MAGDTDSTAPVGLWGPLRLLLLVGWTLLLLGALLPTEANGLKAAPIGKFDQPVQVLGPAGAKRQLFVVELHGVVRVVGPKGKVGKFLDIRDRVGTAGEQGLLSIAFPPNYRKNGRFYAFFNDKTGDVLIEEFRRSPRRHRRALPGSARPLLRIGHRDHTTHNGGQLQFGPDGNLWIAVGDGGGGGDPQENAQDPTTLLGKLLRIDPRRSGGQPYGIPANNPYVGEPGEDEIYAIGLRNPFRFSFDRANGNLLLADVGQATWEEVNLAPWRQANGANFGWDAFEGAAPYEEDEAPSVAPFHTPPVFAYGHGNGNCAITGGYVSRNRRIPAQLGRYVYADYCRGEVRSVRLDRHGAVGDRPVRGLPVEFGIAGFGEDAARRLYVANVESGKVYRITKPAKRGKGKRTRSRNSSGRMR